MTDKPGTEHAVELAGQPFSVCPGTVYAQIGWYTPDTRDFYRLSDSIPPSERLKPVYLYLGNIDAYETA